MRRCAGVFLCLSLETTFVRGEERAERSVEDGIKSNFFFMGLEWERDAGATLGPSIYFSVGVWECWSRLNTLALTKQPKINTVDWGYNNTQQPLLLSGSQPLCDAFRTTHKNQDTEEEGRQEKGGLFCTEVLGWSLSQFVYFHTSTTYF